MDPSILMAMEFMMAIAVELNIVDQDTLEVFR